MKPLWRVRRNRRGTWIILQLDRRTNIYWPYALATSWAAAIEHINQQHQEVPA